jgi:phenylpropionate dioxygenase-like ring-hydroxylating dioxygenase large terminal subunit
MGLDLAPNLMQPPLGVPDDWYVACEARELGRKPLAVELLGLRLVLFRDAAGRARALFDRCSHRNVPLSMGRVCDGQIECPYHGWRFDGQGQCAHVPGLLDDDRDAGAQGRAVPSLLTREADGYLWVYSTVGATRSVREPFSMPFTKDSAYTTVTHVQDFEGSVHAVAENALDVPHTAFVHRGLFRSGGEKRGIDVVACSPPVVAWCATGTASSCRASHKWSTSWATTATSSPAWRSRPSPSTRRACSRA